MKSLWELWRLGCPQKSWRGDGRPCSCLEVSLAAVDASAPPVRIKEEFGNPSGCPVGRQSGASPVTVEAGGCLRENL